MVASVVLVVTTVHPADDPRVRQRTVGVLAPTMPVRYAAQEPAPAVVEGFEWAPLRGGRPVRAVAALREMLRRDVSVVSIHDPELIPLALAARMVGKQVVLDVHEDVPAQMRHKDWLPGPLAPAVAACAAVMLRVAERAFTITLAEDNYQHLFRRSHAVFPNHLLADDLPPPGPNADGPVVYVGDITEARGAGIVVRAVAALPAPRPVELVGRCREPFRTQLVDLARSLGVDLNLPGFLPHPQAMARAAAGAVGVSPLLGLPNHLHSLPTKVIEYLALGLPVVASDLPGTRRAVDGLPGVCLVPPGDVDAWTAALHRAISDSGWRAQALENASDVRRRFTWASGDLRRLFTGLLASTPTASRSRRRRGRRPTS